MGIEDLTLKSCYIGDREVVKLYKGDTLIYEKSSGGGKIYERNGNLIIPAGTVCQIEDWSGEDPGTIEYVLPSDIIISGTEGEVTLSDGQRVWYDANIQEESSSYIGTVDTVNQSKYASSVKKTLNFTKSTALSYGISYRGGLTQGTSFMTPLIHFRITDMLDGYKAMFSLQMYDSYGKNAKFYLHDYGTTKPDDWESFYQVKNPVKISEDDIEVNNQYPGSGDVKYWIWNNRNLCVAEKDHYYSLYVIYTNFPTNLTYLNTGSASFYSRKVTTHYNEPLSVALSGYKFGEAKDVYVSISYNDLQDKLGTTKINEELKYYDVVPNE